MPPKRIRGKPSTARPPPRQISANADAQSSSSEVPSPTTLEQALLQETAWCLDRLETQMKGQGSTPKQVEEARRAWKNLSNPLTPLVKKRQIMRMMFGDYRKTMEQEEKQYSIRPQGMTITQVPTNKASKSKFFKSSSHYVPTHYVPNNVESATADFQFGFHISEDSKTDMASSTPTPETAASYHYPKPGETGGAVGFAFNFDVENVDT